MIDLVLDRAGNRLDDADLHEFESATGQRVPVAYRDFLKLHNGGFPDPRVAYSDRGEEIRLLVFYSVDSENKEFRNAVTALRDTGFRGQFPIALNIANEHICIGPGQQIFVIEWIYDDQDVPVGGKPKRVANSFEMFLEQLSEIVTSTDNVVELSKTDDVSLLEAKIPPDFDFSTKSRNGHTLIEEFSKRGNADAVELCYRQGAEVGQSVHLAVKNNRISVVERLAMLGANLSSKDASGHTPLEFATGPRRKAIKQFLESV